VDSDEPSSGGVCDPALIRKLFMAQQFRLMDYICGLIRDVHAAEDLFQEVSLTVLALESIPVGERDFAPWVRGVAKNLALHHWRRQRRQRVVADDRLLALAEQAFAESDDETDEDFARRRALASCLEGLGQTGRQVLEARYLRDSGAEEIGAMLGKTAEAVRMLLMRLRGKLKLCIDDQISRGGCA
jgi:RNA polymerase sigma-70 factor, ECF subfamily